MNRLKDRLKSYLVAAGILVGAVVLASILVSLAPEPERVEQPPQIPFVQSAKVVLGAGAIPVYGPEPCDPVRKLTSPRRSAAGSTG